MVLASLHDYAAAMECFSAANALRQHDDDGAFLAAFGSAAVRGLKGNYSALPCVGRERESKQRQAKSKGG